MGILYHQAEGPSIGFSRCRCRRSTIDSGFTGGLESPAASRWALSLWGGWRRGRLKGTFWGERMGWLAVVMERLTRVYLTYTGDIYKGKTVPRKLFCLCR